MSKVTLIVLYEGLKDHKEKETLLSTLVGKLPDEIINFNGETEFKWNDLSKIEAEFLRIALGSAKIGASVYTKLDTGVRK
jgi:hypothetical protein